MQCYDSEDFVVADFDGDYFCLAPSGDTIKIDIKLTNHFI